MTLPTSDTRVTYPAGETESVGTVIHCEALSDGRFAVLLDVTACHPVDSGWPDQPADRGFLVDADGAEHEIADCIVGATDGTTLFIGDDVPVRKGTGGWTFVACHLLYEAITEGTPVTVRVDAGHRRALSAGHTACHVASLALNVALSESWTKDVAPDGLGHPNFDAQAIVTSTIVEDGSIDVYRVGKSLRKKGFGVAALDSVEPLEQSINDQLAAWLAGGGSVEISREGDLLTDRREWLCDLAGHEVGIPCGGTHLTGLGELSSVSVSLSRAEADGAIELRMTTTAEVR